MAQNTPHSHNLTAAANAVGSWNCPVLASLLTVTNEASDAWVSVNGQDPAVNGDNTFYVPTGGFVQIPVTEETVAEGGSGQLVVKAISSQALSLWVEVDQ